MAGRIERSAHFNGPEYNRSDIYVGKVYKEEQSQTGEGYKLSIDNGLLAGCPKLTSKTVRLDGMDFQS